MIKMITIIAERIKCVCGQFACPCEQEHQKIFDDFQKQKLSRKQIKDFWHDDLVEEAKNWIETINKIEYEYKGKDSYDVFNIFYKFAQVNLYWPEKYFYDHFINDHFFIEHEIYIKLCCEYIKKNKLHSNKLKRNLSD